MPSRPAAGSAGGKSRLTDGFHVEMATAEHVHIGPPVAAHGGVGLGL